MNLLDRVKKGTLFTTEIGAVNGTNIAALLNSLTTYEHEFDAFNIHDCPGANLRIDPFVEAFRIKEKTSTEVIPHLTCRDAPLAPDKEKPIDSRLLRLLSRLLGAHELGIRYILATGGDLKQENYISTLTLIEAIANLNRGINAKGKEFEGPTEFTIVATANPGAKNVDEEISRMCAKVEKGAMFFQTQPAYDPIMTAEFLRKAKEAGKPVLLGLMPLKGAKMATYMRKLGIHIPDQTIEDLKAGKAGADICSAFLDTLVEGQKAVPDGIHIMAMGNTEATDLIVGRFKENHLKKGGNDSVQDPAYNF
jgi:homocysteine S-methyltransferase